MRARLFQEHPLCVLCLPKGLVRASSIRDHVIPLAEGGLDDETNEQAICADCNAVKTAAESARGVARR
jgi:5-methylcytosine-specific restriction protein A